MNFNTKLVGQILSESSISCPGTTRQQANILTIVSGRLLNQTSRNSVVYQDLAFCRLHLNLVGRAMCDHIKKAVKIDI